MIDQIKCGLFTHRFRVVTVYPDIHGAHALAHQLERSARKLVPWHQTNAFDGIYYFLVARGAQVCLAG